LKSRSLIQASLYIHIPFCDSFCDYCDFFSVLKNTYKDDYINIYLLAVIKDIYSQINYFGINEIPTVYIGGGTPSVIGNKISIILDALKSIPGFNPVEFTIEANLESLTEEFLCICRDGGVNRLSLGIQTFHEPSLITVNRGIGNCVSADFHGFSRIKDRIDLAIKYFPDSLSVDLITGLPFQDEEVALNDIKKIMEINPSFVSLYSLTVENGTVLEDKIKNKTVNMPSMDFADYLWLSGKESLEKAGFEHYEISNFALKNKRSLHNTRYWKMQNWIGVGPAASGTIINEETGTAKRYTYLQDIDKYIKEPHIQNAVYEELDKITLIKESLLMGFRCKDGPNQELFNKRFGFSIEECIPRTLEKWEGMNKMMFLNKFISDAFKELDIKKN